MKKSARARKDATQTKDAKATGKPSKEPVTFQDLTEEGRSMIFVGGLPGKPPEKSIADIKDKDTAVDILRKRGWNIIENEHGMVIEPPDPDFDWLDDPTKKPNKETHEN
jgi:hypothetical protein